MLKIGLTGGIGSGKSLIAKMFGILGAPVYYADDEARRLMNSDSGLRKAISGIFGPRAYEQGELNRSYLACMAFDNPDLLDRLNAAVHPAVHRDFMAWCNRHKDRPYVIEEAAILVESGASKHFDFLVVIYADVETRIRRVVERDNISERDVRNRMNRQMPPEEINKHADFIIQNDGTHLVVPRVLELHEKFVSLHVS